jgi:hypothetical protein
MTAKIVPALASHRFEIENRKSKFENFMSLTPEQKAIVSTWVAAGDNLSAIQKKLSDELKISMTYRDVRFLVDDLDLTLKDAAPKVDTSDISKATPPPAPAAAAPRAGEAGKKGFFDKAKEKLGLGKEEESAAPSEEEAFVEDELDNSPAGAASVSVAVDNVTLIPGAVASGSVTFSDGVTGKWIIDQYGRPGFTEVSQKGYRPKPADAQAFMQELSRALQQRGY